LVFELLVGKRQVSNPERGCVRRKRAFLFVFHTDVALAIAIAKFESELAMPVIVIAPEID